MTGWDLSSSRQVRSSSRLSQSLVQVALARTAGGEILLYGGREGARMLAIFKLALIKIQLYKAQLGAGSDVGERRRGGQVQPLVPLL